MQDGGREAFGEDTMESEEEGYFGSEDRGEKQYGSRIDYRQELNLSGRNLSYLPSQHLASTYVSLTTLNISGNAISRLEGLPQTLTSLDASNNLLRSVSGLEESFSLANLVLDHNSITGLSGLENCTSLAELSVSNNDLRSLSGLECCVNLTRINATSNHIANIESLRTLSLNTKLSWMGLKYVPPTNLFLPPLPLSLSLTPPPFKPFWLQLGPATFPFNLDRFTPFNLDRSPPTLQTFNLDRSPLNLDRQLATSRGTTRTGTEMHASTTSNSIASRSCISLCRRHIRDHGHGIDQRRPPCPLVLQR